MQKSQCACFLPTAETCSRCRPALARAKEKVQADSMHVCWHFSSCCAGLRCDAVLCSACISTQTQWMMHWWISSTPLLVSLMNTSQHFPLHALSCTVHIPIYITIRVLFEVCRLHHKTTYANAYVCFKLCASTSSSVCQCMQRQRVLWRLLYQ